MYSDSSNKRRLSVVLAVLAALALLAAVHWLRGGRWAQSPIARHMTLPTTARLVIVGGEAVVSRADAGVDPPLRTGASALMQRGDEVRTGAEGRARLTFSGGEVVEMGSNTRIAILELHETRATGPSLSRGLIVLLALEEGQATTRIRHMLFQGSRFVIETRVATVEARGTLFDCQVIDKERIRVAVHEGVVTISMGEQELQLEAGQGVVARLGQPLTPDVVPTLLAPRPDAPPASEASAETPSAAKMPTLTNLQKTLFPPVITPTRPGDAPIQPVTNGVLGVGKNYVVQPGDTLYSIARSQGVSWDALWQANKDILASPELIHPGQTLRVPTP